MASMLVATSTGMDMMNLTRAAYRALLEEAIDIELRASSTHGTSYTLTRSAGNSIGLMVSAKTDKALIERRRSELFAAAA